MSDPILRAAYDAGFTVGRTTSGLPAQCPFKDSEAKIAERMAWLSGFSVARLVPRGR